MQNPTLLGELYHRYRQKQHICREPWLKLGFEPLPARHFP